MVAVKTGKIIKYLICLFAAAAVLIFAGGAKMWLSVDSHQENSAKVKEAARLYISSVESGESLRNLAEESPEYLIYAASSSTLKTVETGIFE